MEIAGVRVLWHRLALPRLSFLLNYSLEAVWENCFPSITAGWTWDEEVRSHLDDGIGRDFTISCRKRAERKNFPVKYRWDNPSETCLGH